MGFSPRLPNLIPNKVFNALPIWFNNTNLKDYVTLFRQISHPQSIEELLDIMNEHFILLGDDKINLIK